MQKIARLSDILSLGGALSYKSANFSSKRTARGQIQINVIIECKPVRPTK